MARPVVRHHRLERPHEQHADDQERNRFNLAGVQQKAEWDSDEHQRHQNGAGHDHLVFPRGIAGAERDRWALARLHVH